MPLLRLDAPTVDEWITDNNVQEVLDRYNLVQHQCVCSNVQFWLPHICRHFGHDIPLVCIRSQLILWSPSRERAFPRMVSNILRPEGAADDWMVDMDVLKQGFQQRIDQNTPILWWEAFMFFHVQTMNAAFIFNGKVVFTVASDTLASLQHVSVAFLVPPGQPLIPVSSPIATALLSWHEPTEALFAGRVPENYPLKAESSAKILLRALPRPNRGRHGDTETIVIDTSEEEDEHKAPSEKSDSTEEFQPQAHDTEADASMNIDRSLEDKDNDSFIPPQQEDEHALDSVQENSMAQEEYTQDDTVFEHTGHNEDLSDSLLDVANDSAVVIQPIGQDTKRTEQSADPQTVPENFEHSSGQLSASEIIPTLDLPQQEQSLQHAEIGDVEKDVDQATETDRDTSQSMAKSDSVNQSLPASTDLRDPPAAVAATASAPLHFPATEDQSRSDSDTDLNEIYGKHLHAFRKQKFNKDDVDALRVKNLQDQLTVLRTDFQLRLQQSVTDFKQAQKEAITRIRKEANDQREAWAREHTNRMSVLADKEDNVDGKVAAAEQRANRAFQIISNVRSVLDTAKMDADELVKQQFVSLNVIPPIYKDVHKSIAEMKTEALKLKAFADKLDSRQDRLDAREKKLQEAENQLALAQAELQDTAQNSRSNSPLGHIPANDDSFVEVLENEEPPRSSSRKTISCEHCPRHYTAKESLQQHLVAAHQYTICKCGELCANTDQLSAHTLKCKFDATIKLPKLATPVKDQQGSASTSHVKKKHKKKAAAAPERKRTAPCKLKMETDSCGFTFFEDFTTPSCEDWLDSNHGDYVCPCGTVLSNLANAKDHYQRAHTDEIICYWCVSRAVTMNASKHYTECRLGTRDAPRHYQKSKTIHDLIPQLPQQQAVFDEMSDLLKKEWDTKIQTVLLVDRMKKVKEIYATVDDEPHLAKIWKQAEKNLKDLAEPSKRRHSASDSAEASAKRHKNH